MPNINWACSEIIVALRKLDNQEIICVESYLRAKYPTKSPTESGSPAKSNNRKNDMTNHNIRSDKDEGKEKVFGVASAIILLILLVVMLLFVKCKLRKAKKK
eukprot:410435_1